MYFASFYRWLVVRNWLRVSRTSRILDVGCDDGEIVARVEANFRVGCDLNPRCPDARVRLVHSDARSLPLASGSFDSVFAFDIIEHIIEDEMVLAELVRVMASDGTLYLSTPSDRFSIFPRFLMSRVNRGWGHVRNGYSVVDLTEKLPTGVVAEFMYWNEPVLRALHLPLRILDFSTWLTCGLAQQCYHLDRILASGTNGHLFVRVRKTADDERGL